MLRPLLADGRGYDIFPTTEQELVDGLMDMDALFRKEGEPRIAVLYGEPEKQDTARLSIGLGADECVLGFDTGDPNDTGALSRGPREGDQEEVGFAYGDGYSDFYAAQLVPKDVAIEAARQYFRTGRRPTNVSWHQL